MAKKNISPLVKAGWWLTTLLMKGFVWILCRLPLSWARGLGRGLGSLVFAVDAKHRAIALENLKRAFPEKSDEWRLATARASMRNLVENFFEFFHLSDKDRETVLGRVEFPDMAAVEALKNEGKGFLYLTGHCGNWEVLAQAVSANGYPFGAMARPLDNYFLNDLIDGIRSRFGSQVISRKKGMRQLVRALSDGCHIGVLLDQNVDRKEGVFVNFFGEMACTNRGLAVLARRQYPVIPGFIHRDGSRHCVMVGAPLALVNTGDEERDIAENTALFTRVVEEHIRQYPEEWLWFHRRWKTRPLKDSKQ